MRPRPLQYILQGRLAVPTEDHMEWALWLEDHNHERRVAETEIGAVTISTVFIGLDHNFSGGEPHIFETMIFGGKLDGQTWRCATWSDAEALHKAACEQVRATIGENNEQSI